MSFTITGYRDGQPVTVEWEDGLAIASPQLVGALCNAADAETPIEIHPDGRIIAAALEPSEVAFATILALLDGMPGTVQRDVPELFRDPPLGRRRLIFPPDTP